MDPSGKAAFAQPAPDGARLRRPISSHWSMKVHAIQAGCLRGNKTTTRGSGLSSMFRRRVSFEFPAFVYILEHPDGHIAIDTGMSARGWTFPFYARRIAPGPATDSKEDEVGPRMRAAGLKPEDVRTVVLTHLDVDHVGGAHWFSNARLLAHRRELEFTSTLLGKPRYQTHLWPTGFDPLPYDLDPEPCGPFPESKAVTNDGIVSVVPLAGHSIGQVGVLVRLDDIALFFTADHVLRQDWFLEDRAAGRPCEMVSANFWMRRFRRLAAETTRRIEQFIRDVPTVLLPAHDTDAPRRLSTLETVRL